jgi:hypothetical protein
VSEWIEVEGDKPKVERTRHYFAAMIAGMKTAQGFAESATTRRWRTLRAALAALDAHERSEPAGADNASSGGEMPPTGDHGGAAVSDAASPTELLAKLREIDPSARFVTGPGGEELDP